MAEEGLTVGKVGRGLAGVGGGVEPSAFAQLLLGAIFKCSRFYAEVNQCSYMSARKANEAIPVLKGMTLPSLLAQKPSRWYSAYSGVLRKLLFSFLVSMAAIVQLLAGYCSCQARMLGEEWEEEELTRWCPYLDWSAINLTIARRNSRGDTWLTYRLTCCIRGRSGRNDDVWEVPETSGPGMFEREVIFYRSSFCLPEA